MSLADKKGQAWMSDFLVMVILLFGIVFLFIFLWGQYTHTASIRLSYNRMWVAASQAGDALVTTAGFPPSWENLDNDSIHSIGLAAAPNVLSVQKLERLSQLNQTLLQSRLGLSDYTVHITLRSVNQNETVYELGNNLSSTLNRVTLTRLVLYNQSLSVFTLEVSE
ncbi:MAG TPA: hypothetical protein VJH24_05960 [Candidatus Bilamarchaeaceae archaeon]|nr:hypothetical protein [Candidatus Bilamarchaeaceae archaeon]